MPLHLQAAEFLQAYARLEQPPLESTPAAESRQLLNAAIGVLPDCPTLAAINDLQIPGPGGPLRIRIYRPRIVVNRGACLYFHGGGWVLNSIDTHDDFVRRLTDTAGCVCVSVDYRLAPEHPFPAAAEDAYAALQWVAANAYAWDIDPTRLAVAGDSAGGNLAAVCCLMTRDRGGPPIRQQILAYPITDCDFTRPSYRENADGYFLTTAQMRWFWDQYCPDEKQRRHPYASPLHAESLRGLPPAFVFTAEFDPLRDEGEAYAAALSAAGVPVTFQQFPGMIHAFLRRVTTFDAAKTALRQIGSILQTGFQE
ncbi:MAG TPA: alpha/beta hydrolase [Planctomycetaceae bacterium]|nr:alpha/beta hydrolase [Planctomycetaceae bacterium]